MAGYNIPTADFLTTSLSGVLAAGATSAAVGTGLNLPATNGVLELSYDTANAIGVTDGPETISYTSYTSGTGALAGLVRGLASTTNVQHSSGQSVQAALSAAHFTTTGEVGKINVNQGAWTAFVSAVGGYSGTPTQNVAAQLNGKRCDVRFNITGTSATTGLTFDLPYNAKVQTDIIIRAQDNGGTWVAGLIEISAGSNVANVYATVGAGNWTGSGTKSIQGGFRYEIA